MRASTIKITRGEPVWKGLLRIKLVLKKEEEKRKKELYNVSVYQTLVYPPEPVDLKQRIKEIGFLRL